MQLTIAHLSDVHLAPVRGIGPGHFNVKRALGLANWLLKRRKVHLRTAVDALVADLARQQIDHIIVSGDLVNLGNKTVFYYLSFTLLLAAIYLCHRLVQSRFGMVICASRSNDRRMNAIGFPTYRYRLVAFVIAGAVCGLSGVLLANHGDFVSPAVMHWTRSGDLIVMVVLGGMGALFGPLYGTVAFLLLEELMSSHLPKPLNESWQIFFGPMLVLVVLFAKGGIDSLLARASEVRG